MKRALILSLLSFFFDANASELVEIRTGSHLNFSRVVLQFDAMAKFQISQDLEHKIILVDCEVDRVQDPGTISIYPMDEFLQSVEPAFSGRILSVAIQLKSANVALRHYTLARPYRLVLDISMGGISVSRHDRDRSFVAPARNVDSAPMDPREVSVATAVKTFVAPAADEPMKIEVEPLTMEQKTGAADRDSLLPASPIDLQISQLKRVQDLHHPNRVKEQTAQVVAQPGKQGWTRVHYGLAILVGFLVLDILIFIYLKISTRQKKSILEPTSARVAEQLARSKKAQMTSRGPEPVKPTPPAAEFVEALTKAMDLSKRKGKQSQAAKGEEADRAGKPASPLEASLRLPEVQNEMDQVNAVIRIDSMIASLSDAVGKPADKFTYVPELTDILHDMKSKMSPESQPEQLTKEVLIGQDGVDFVKNLRRLFLN